MKTLPELLRYFLTWQRGIFWLFLVGLALLLACIPVALLFDRHTAYGLSIYAYAGLLGLPYLLAWYPFRQLIASQRLALLPDFHLQAGIALLLLTVLVSIYLPLAASLLWPGLVPWTLAIRLFFACSVYTWLLQWLCTTSLFVPAVSIGPFLVALILFRFGAHLQPLLGASVLDTLLLLISVGGWLWGLRVLTAQRGFNPPLKTPFNNHDFMSGSWIVPFSGPGSASRSPAGTLLLGYPDGWSSRCRYALNLLIISPLVCVVLLALVGTGMPNENMGAAHLAGLFVLFALITSIVTSLSHGELAARGRMLWLRRGGDRHAHWAFLERILLGNLALQALLLATLAFLAALIPEAAKIPPAVVVTMTMACCLLGSYFSLAARAGRWPLITFIVMTCLLGPGIAFAFIQRSVPMTVMVVVLLLLSLLFRSIARRQFLTIDWRLVPLLRENTRLRQS